MLRMRRKFDDRRIRNGLAATRSAWEAGRGSDRRRQVSAREGSDGPADRTGLVRNGDIRDRREARDWTSRRFVREDPDLQGDSFDADFVEDDERVPFQDVRELPADRQRGDDADREHESDLPGYAFEADERAHDERIAFQEKVRKT